jgi:hypothetical protein
MSELGRAAPVIYGAGASDCFQPKSEAGPYRPDFGRPISRQKGGSPPSIELSAKRRTAFKYKTRLRSAAIISIHAPEYIRLLYHGNALLYFAALKECF